MTYTLTLLATRRRRIDRLQSSLDAVCDAIAAGTATSDDIDRAPKLQSTLHFLRSTPPTVLTSTNLRELCAKARLMAEPLEHIEQVPAPAKSGTGAGRGARQRTTATLLKSRGEGNIPLGT